MKVRSAHGSDSRTGGGRIWIRIVAGLSLGFLTAVAVRTWIVHPVTLVNSAMAPLYKKDSTVFILLLKFGRELQIGDTVLIQHPLHSELRMLRLIVGMPGDRIAIRNGQFYRNGKEEGTVTKHTKSLTSRASNSRTAMLPQSLYPRDMIAELLIPPHSYYFLSLNASTAIDSRQLGPIPASNVLGRVIH